MITFKLGCCYEVLIDGKEYRFQFVGQNRAKAALGVFEGSTTEQPLESIFPRSWRSISINRIHCSQISMKEPIG